MQDLAFFPTLLHHFLHGVLEGSNQSDNILEYHTRLFVDLALDSCPKEGIGVLEFAAGDFEFVRVEFFVGGAFEQKDVRGPVAVGF